MGVVDLHDNKAKNKQKLQKRLLDLVHQDILAHGVYGLPNTHKENIPHRPILSMIGSC